MTPAQTRPGRAEYFREWYLNNAEAEKASAKQRRLANLPHSNEVKAAYRKANKEKIKAYTLAKHLENPEKRKAHHAKYRRSHGEQIKAYKVAYKTANPEKVSTERNKRYAAKAEISKVQMAYTVAWLRPTKDSNIAGYLGMGLLDCPPDLLALKREQLTLVRAIRDLNKQLRVRA
jgi:hypothetical protein